MTRLFVGGAVALLATAAVAAQSAPPPGVAQGTAPMAGVRPAPQIRTFVHRMPMKTETRDEVVAHVREMFAKLDGNKDGYVTRAEAQAGHQALAGEIHQRLEKRVGNHDFAMPDRGAMFDLLDTNKDGSISRSEFLSAKPQIHQERRIVMRDGEGPIALDAGPGSPGVRVMRFHRSGFGMAMHGQMFERADANHDGRVSQQEMTDAALQHFDAADVNHDGRLSPEERMQMHRQHDERRMPPA